MGTIALFIWVILAQLPGQPSKRVVKKQSTPATQLPKNAENNEQTTENTILKGMDAITKEQEAHAAAENEETANEGETIKTEWDLVYIGVAQTIALILTFWAVWKQAEKTAEAAKATSENVTEIKKQVAFMDQQTVSMKETADAAKINAQALINAERPWLLIDISPHDSKPGTYVVRAVNKGRTPAEMLEGHCGYTVAEVGGFIPEPDFVAPFFAPLQGLTVSDDSFEIIKEIDPAFLLEQAGQAPFPVAPYVYGRIYYWDTFTDIKKADAKPHETWWCFTWDQYRKRWYRSANGYSKNT